MHPLSQLLITVVVFAVMGARPLCAQSLTIHQIDVEQGDAALVVMPNGKTLLIDSGKNGHGRRVRAAMTRAGVTRIDAFVATHYHEDHFGGIDDLVDMGVPVLEAYDRGDKACCLSSSKRAEQTFNEYQRAVGENAHTLRAGGTIDLDPLVTITAVSSGGDVIGQRNPVLGRDENDMSISLLIAFRGFKAFFGGDIEAPTEAAVAANDLVMNVDYYKANHHGSDTSSSPAFMSDLTPSLIVVSNGSNASYHHPRHSVLDGYRRLNPAPVVLQTNKCLVPSPCANVPDSFIADPESRDEDGTVEVVVDGTGRYSVHYADTLLTFTVKAPDLTERDADARLLDGLPSYDSASW
jgi:competence protein ComEC